MTLKHLHGAYAIRSTASWDGTQIVYTLQIIDIKSIGNMEYWKIDLPWNVADYNRSRRLGKQITLEAPLIPLKQDQTNILSVPTRGRMSFTITHTNMMQMNLHMMSYKPSFHWRPTKTDYSLFYYHGLESTQ